MGILSGYKKVKRYVKESGGYKLLSQWVSSQTVEMDDGTTLESNKVGWDAAKTHANSYGTCFTSASTVAKTVSCTGFTLTTSSEITVKFTYANTAANPTLNVNSTGAKPIYCNGSAITSGLLVANGTYMFRYNGTQWDLVGSAGGSNSSGGEYADKAIYGDTSINLGRTSGYDIGNKSIAFGVNVKAIGDYSCAIGPSTETGKYAFAAGYIAKATGENSSALGYNVEASGPDAHAEGCNTIASMTTSHAEGWQTKATGNYSHSEGCDTTASREASHAEGYRTTTGNYASHACGKYNAVMTGGGSASNTSGTVFVIGNGSSSALSNAFSVMFNGIVKAKSTITGSTTADYAEFFEWEDGNPNKEDRVGKFVTIKGDKISIAKSNKDYILGIVSGEPFVLGNGDCDTWNGMYLKDEFNRTIYEPAPKVELDVETGEMIEIFEEDGTPVFEGTRPKLNPDYDPNQPYISRFDRKEWAPVGMLGVLSVIHDGTCKVNEYCCCNSEGIATACDRHTEGACRVIQEMTDNVVRVILK